MIGAKTWGVKRLIGSRRIALSLQSEGAECGLACIAMICSYYDIPLSLNQLRRHYGSSRRGDSIARLVGILRDLGVNCSALKVDSGYIPSLQGVWIAHWEFNHFVVIESVGGGRVRVLDPARGKYVANYCDIAASLTGVVIECSSAAASEAWLQVSEVEDGSELRFRRFCRLVGGRSGLDRKLVVAVLLSLLIELGMLLLPLHMKWIVDGAVAGLDRSDVLLWAGAFSLVALLLCLAMYIQGFLLSKISATMSLRWTVGLLTRFMSLSPEFSMRRSVADVLSRFQSLRIVQMALTGAFVRAIIDGLASVVTISVIIYIDVFAGIFVSVIALIYLLLRLVTVGLVVSSSTELAGVYARQQGVMMECVRGMPAIKLSGKEVERVLTLEEVTKRVSEKDVLLQKISALFQALSAGMVHWQRIALLSAGVILGSSAGSQIGATIVLVILADQFLVRSNMLVDRLVQFSELGAHVSRVDEIARESPELLDADSTASFRMDRPSITLVNIGYRYSAADPWIFRGICMHFDFGESVAIVGPSGRGKSTIVKIIVGLLQPTEGWIEVDGVKVENIGLARYRAIMSSVMQDDHLFAGSLRDNISFFDRFPDEERVRSSALMAEIDVDIDAMPMRYETLVGEMGGAISGGQKQRLLLARALYAMTPVLVLDEATSYLSVDCEQRVVDRIRSLEMTRIVVAHRPDSINMCDRIIEL